MLIETSIVGAMDKQFTPYAVLMSTDYALFKDRAKADEYAAKHRGRVVPLCVPEDIKIRMNNGTPRSDQQASDPTPACLPGP